MCLAQWPQRSDAGEAQTRGPSVSSQALYHWATALPVVWVEQILKAKTLWSSLLSYSFRYRIMSKCDGCKCDCSAALPFWHTSFEWINLFLLGHYSMNVQIQKVLSEGFNFDGFFFSLMRGGRIQIPLLAGHQRPASEMPFNWRFAGGPMIAQHRMLAW